ncbi:IS66 family insertion sequence element accessory protein TnpB [Bradyrhizobium sp. sBnM-33]|uniref:IS66 family insertion sequence element accessory protein TnpB n=1 Tax=Bradyrhizobium sp. sBnM-33 TaxID=2831780 RepID=UPI00293F363A|nr:IS66 family insertion sequence element accessory protein TnpB [Bradyrhizobium sp. sBnM-33]WOH52499.1 IS66 family insertion sequence element accessory protein TnpB [Bradyrhizobium sp. sBnM-33]
MSAIARAHGLDPSQVFAWRRKALASGVVAPLSERARPIKFARFEAVAGETMEIVVGDVAVRIGSDVEPERLAAVIALDEAHSRTMWSRSRGSAGTWPEPTIRLQEIP